MEHQESDHEENYGGEAASSSDASCGSTMQDQNEYDMDCEIEIDDESQPFAPSVKIRRIDNTLLISTIVLKDVALSSSLFSILEEEKLDIVFENQYRTEHTVAHTVQVKVQPDYDINELEMKLCRWAGKPV
ncbi:PREDICTED: uncharacterized protein LOC104587334 [Nelumbo nucifera]|uniref:Uncharacterized protein n=2 Tax=Nelumbo nucifera TaxID=4432 RepID=A0A822Y952_NELNU|nr:PREDICTED: uncharacterized protein LOC104587334 [Nelumbo nucifera]DAD28603.1 TPA_asm: hypothetical protein HUJ06_030071 [Nelumbo nucifera]